MIINTQTLLKHIENEDIPATPCGYPSRQPHRKPKVCQNKPQSVNIRNENVKIPRILRLRRFSLCVSLRKYMKIKKPPPAVFPLCFPKGNVKTKRIRLRRFSFVFP